MLNVYDEALALLAGTAPEYAEGQPNSGATVAAAMVTMDQSHAVVPWLKDYLGRLEPMPAPGEAITRDNWRQALGHGSRASDWTRFFQRELQQAPWRQVIGDWIPKLAPGLSGGGGHPLLHTAAALVGLVAEDHALRKDELGRALGHWASRYLKLPGIVGSTTGGNMSPAEALARIKWQHKDKPRRFKGLASGLQGLAGFPSFAGVVNLIAVPDDPLTLISQITESMTRVYLAHSHDEEKLLPFVQGVAIPSALRSIAPQLPSADVASLLRHGWQFAGAVYAIYGRANPAESWEQPEPERADLIEQAVASGNEHVILFVATCLHEYAAGPNPVYLAAAGDAVSRMAKV